MPDRLLLAKEDCRPPYRQVGRRSSSPYGTSWYQPHRGGILRYRWREARQARASVARILVGGPLLVWQWATTARHRNRRCAHPCTPARIDLMTGIVKAPRVAGRRSG